MLKIPIKCIDKTGFDLDQRIPIHRLGLLAALSNDEGVRLPGPVHANIHADLAGESILIRGRVETRAVMRCSRCIEWFEIDLGTDFTATAIPDPVTTADPQRDGEIELSAEEMAVITYSGDSVPLDGEIAQQIIMALPIRPLCRENCRGLCSRCGANLNQSACQCDRSEASSPFSILKTLSLPGKKE